MTTATTVAQAILDLLLQGDLSGASLLVTENYPREQNNPEFLYIAGRVAREARNLDTAKQIFTRLAALAHDDSNVHELGYKIMYDDNNLEAALRHMAAGSRTAPPNVFMKQLALQQVVLSDIQDQWLSMLCDELAAIEQEPESHQRTAAVLINGHKYDKAIQFLQRGLNALGKSKSSLMHKDAFINDIHAVTELQAGRAPRLPDYPADDAAWQKMQALMAAASAAEVSGPKGTIIVTSHISNKLALNAHKAPPSTVLLQETLASFRQHAQLPGDWPMVICFDAPATPQPEAEAAYLAALSPVCDAHNATLRTYRGAGLRQVFLDVYKDITTPYFMLLEHDWTCARTVEPLMALANAMDQNPRLHHMRYPRHHTHINQSDCYLINHPDMRADIPLLMTPYFSNNPGLTRVAHFTRNWLPLITASNAHDSTNNGAGGIEETINAHSMGIMHRWGIFANITTQGCAVIGRINDAPRIIHTGI